MRPTLLRVGVAVFAALMLAIVLGVPPFPELASHIPIVKTGNHLRLVIVLMLCLALLAGWGLDDLTRRVPAAPAAPGLPRRPAGPRRCWCWRPAASCRAGLLGRALEIAGGSWPQPPARRGELTAIRMASLIVWLTFMGLAVALLARAAARAAGGRPSRSRWPSLVAGDLFKAGHGGDAGDRRPSDATQPSTPGLRYLESRRPNRFVGSERPLGPSPLIPNTAMRWRLYDARG